MPYTATSYTTGGTATAADLDHGETQYQEATLSFNPDLFTAFVYSGLVASKDATVLNQLDVTSGTAYVKQTDGTLRQRVLTSSTQTTSVASTTYYLDLNPDGTWSWGTAHSATANYLPIASVTTDASANIATVTDARGVNTTLLSGMAGTITIPNLTVSGTFLIRTNFSGNMQVGWDPNLTGNMFVSTPLSGASAHGVYFPTWDGSASHIPFAIGTNPAGGTYIDHTGIFHGAAAVYDTGNRVAVVGNHSGGQTIVSYGNGAPSSLQANEVYFQLT